MADELPRDPLLADIEGFLRATNMTPTAFGQRALNDPALVHEMRRGRECKWSTRSRIMAFIADHSQRAEAAA